MQVAACCGRRRRSAAQGLDDEKSCQQHAARHQQHGKRDHDSPLNVQQYPQVVEIVEQLED